jgi:hypothetical protein
MNRRVWAMSTVAVASLVLAGATMAEGTTGNPVLLGRHNCSGTVTDRTCSGGTRTTSIDWNLDLNPVPINTGLAVDGDPGILGTTNPEYVQPTEIIAGVEGFGSDAGAFLYGVDWGAVTRAEYVGLDAHGGEVGVQATGDVAIEADGAVAFSSSGLVTVPEGRRTARVTVEDGVNLESKVLAMAQTPGGSVKRVLRGDGEITIVLAAAATRNVEIAYFVIS